MNDTEMDLDHEDSKAGYLIRMLAYRYQVHDFRKTQKPHVAFYFYGKQGYGKTIFSTTLQEVFGTSAVMSTPDERSLNSMSFVDIFSRTWAVVDEVNIAKGSTDYNAIKTMTGNTRTDAARKGEHFKYRYIPAQSCTLRSHPPSSKLETGGSLSAGGNATLKRHKIRMIISGTTRHGSTTKAALLLLLGY